MYKRQPVGYYLKLFLNPQTDFLPQTQEPGWRQRDAELAFEWDPERKIFKVKAYQGMRLSCRPRLKRGEMPPAHRFPPLASPSEYTKPYFAESEDDVLHMWDLPDFGSLDVGNAKALGQHDSELLLSYLTVPYMRIPLLLAFFSQHDRVHSLQSPKLQDLLDGALFEPSHFLPRAHAAAEIADVPTSEPHLLATAHGLLLNELVHSPQVVRESVVRLARQAVDLDTGHVKASTSTVILYVVRLCARVDNYASLLIALADGSHETLSLAQCRGLHAAQLRRVLPQLEQLRAELRAVLHGPLQQVLAGWYRKLVKECENRFDDSVLDENTKMMCSVQAHVLLSCARHAGSRA